MERIYLDFASNRPSSESALKAFVDAETSFPGNANSLHEEGKASLAFYLSLCEEMLALLGLDSSLYEVVPTSGATEANNLAIKGVAESYSAFGLRFLSSEFEHSSVNAALAYEKDKGAEVELVKTTDKGKLDLGDLKTKATHSPYLLLCLCAIESEAGAIQPYSEAQEIVTSSNGRMLLDATQAIGKIPLNLSGIDMVSFSSHKFGGVNGAGALIKKKSIVLTPLLHGGKSPTLYRSGTPALGLLASTVAALKEALRDQKTNEEKVRQLYGVAASRILSIPGALLNSFGENPYILNFSLSGVPASKLVEYLSSKGVDVSQKSACSVPSSPSKTINAIYHDKKRALSSLRFSFAPSTTLDEVNQALSILKEYPR